MASAAADDERPVFLRTKAEKSQRSIDNSHQYRGMIATTAVRPLMTRRNILEGQSLFHGRCEDVDGDGTVSRVCEGGSYASGIHRELGYKAYMCNHGLVIKPIIKGGVLVC
jgi:hypothetical protein